MTLDPDVACAEAQVEHTRERLSRSVLALRRTVAKQSDWHEWVRRRPGLILTAAFTLGFLLGQGLSRRRAADSR